MDRTPVVIVAGASLPRNAGTFGPATTWIQNPIYEKAS